jgi:Ca-activated chloride channel family protein
MLAPMLASTPRTARLAAVLLAVAAGACGGPAKQLRDPNLVRLAAEPTADRVPAGAPARLALRLRVTAADLGDADRPPLNLALVIDTSGSMEGAAIAEARRAAGAIVDRMRDGDRIAVVGFGTRAEVLVASSRVDRGMRTRAHERIAAMAARGTTDLASGLAVGLAQLADGHTADSLDRIVLLSDGVPNDASSIPALVQQAQGQQIAISALGLGIEFDETLLDAIASATGGSYRYAERPEVVAELFDREVLRLQRLVGRDLHVTLTPGPGVMFEEIPGFSIGAGPGARSIMLGDLASGEVRDIIVPVSVTGRRDGATVELVDAVLRFEDVAGASGTQTRDAFVKVVADADAARVAAAVKTDLQIAALRAEAAGAMLQAIATARGGDPAAAQRLLVDAEQRARTAAAQHDDRDLLDLADRMIELSPNLAALAPRAPMQLAPEAAPSMSQEDAQSFKSSYSRARSVNRGE